MLSPIHYPRGGSAVHRGAIAIPNPLSLSLETFQKSKKYLSIAHFLFLPLIYLFKMNPAYQRLYGVLICSYVRCLDVLGYVDEDLALCDAMLLLDNVDDYELFVWYLEARDLATDVCPFILEAIGRLFDCNLTTFVPACCISPPKPCSEDFPGQICSICQEPLGLVGPVLQLSCGHVFDPACIHAWLATSASCPICRCVIRREDHLIV